MTETPNVVVQSPKIRRAANWILGIVGLVLGTLIVVDGASDAFTLAGFTGPASAAYLYLGSAFQIGVTLPNVPKSH